MRRTRVNDALNSQAPMEQILVKGWVRTRRDAKGVSFLEINDGSSLNNLQAVVAESALVDGSLTGVSTGAAVEVEGALVESPGKGQRWEVQATQVRLVGAADPDTFPLQKKRHTDEFLRSIAHLRPRTNKYGALFRIRSESAFAVHAFFRDRGFYYLHTPIITGSDCEGAGAMFRVTTLPPGVKEPAPSAQGLRRRLFRPGGLSHCVGTIGGRAVCLRPRRCLHLRPHVPGRKLEHPPPCGRVLDDRAGDGVCRFAGRHGPGRGVGQKPWSLMRWSTAPRTWSCLPSLWIQELHERLEVIVTKALCATALHRGGSRS